MIFDHYWKKRAMKAERELRSARGTAAAAKALREDQEDRFQQLNERDTYQAIAIETLQEENRNLRRQHRRDEDLVEELEKEIEEKEATLNTLRGVMQVMEENNRRLWERIYGDDACGRDTAAAGTPHPAFGHLPLEGKAMGSDQEVAP